MFRNDWETMLRSELSIVFNSTCLHFNIQFIYATLKDKAEKQIKFHKVE